VTAQHPFSRSLGSIPFPIGPSDASMPRGGSYGGVHPWGVLTARDVADGTGCFIIRVVNKQHRGPRYSAVPGADRDKESK